MTIAFWSQLNLKINRVRLSAVGQLSDAPRSRAYSYREGLREAVVKQLNYAAHSLPFGRQAGQSECCLDEANFFRGGLVPGLDDCRIGEFLPKSSCLHAMFAARSPVPLHLLPIATSQVVRKIAPSDSIKVLHHSPPLDSSLILSATQLVNQFSCSHGRRRVQPEKNIDLWGITLVLNQVNTVIRETKWPRKFRRARDYRSEERRVGKECRSRWSPYH